MAPGYLTEKETLAALKNLHRDSWLLKYIQHGFVNTSCPIAYHVGTGLAILSTTCPKDYGFLYAGGDLYANMYCLLLGRSGEDQKTASLKIGSKILRTVDPTYTSIYPGSREGLLDSLAAQPKQLMIVDELGDILSSAARGHLETIKPALTALWDCSPMSRVKAGNNVIRVDEPRLSIAAACSLPYLETYTLTQDWHGGFMGRWFVLYGFRQRTISMPRYDDTRKAALQAGLTTMLSQSAATICTAMTPAAEKLWDTWFNELNERDLPAAVISIKSRGPTMALKVALLIAWDYGKPREDINWKMDIDVLQPAIDITELHIKSLIHLSYEIAETSDARMRRTILKSIETYCTRHQMPMGLDKLLGETKINIRDIQKYVDTLIAERKIKKMIVETGVFYDLLDYQY